MKRARGPTFLLLSAAALLATPAFAQTGSIEFVARVTPAGGIAEPVRELPFYLLSKSFADVAKEADQSEPKPDMDAFIDKLTISKELKAWMKRNHRLTLTGEEFTRHANVADIMDVPEFLDAYLRLNAGDRSVNFPKPKYKNVDPKKDPEKFKKLSDEYHEAVRRYLTQNPDSTQGIDLELAEIDPTRDWQELAAKREPAVHRRIVELAQSKYLVARTTTDLEGRGSLQNISPGDFWLSTLEITAAVGEARLRWDTPVTVRAGQVTRIELSNVNAAEMARSSP